MIEQCAGNAGVLRPMSIATIFFLISAVASKIRPSLNKEVWPAKFSVSVVLFFKNYYYYQVFGWFCSQFYFILFWEFYNFLVSSSHHKCYYFSVYTFRFLIFVGFIIIFRYFYLQLQYQLLRIIHHFILYFIYG
jgi:hypothetical protein